MQRSVRWGNIAAVVLVRAGKRVTRRGMRAIKEAAGAPPPSAPTMAQKGY